MKHVLGFAVLLGVGLATTSCRVHAHHVSDNDHGGTEVIIKHEHAHTKYCGHYRVGRRWFYLPQHRHGVNCGHIYQEDVWAVEE